MGAGVGQKRTVPRVNVSFLYGFAPGIVLPFNQGKAIQRSDSLQYKQ